jgi:hypothetical protein
LLACPCATICAGALLNVVVYLNLGNNTTQQSSLKYQVDQEKEKVQAQAQDNRTMEQVSMTGGKTGGATHQHSKTGAISGKVKTTIGGGGTKTTIPQAITHQDQAHKEITLQETKHPALDHKEITLKEAALLAQVEVEAEMETQQEMQPLEIKLQEVAVEQEMLKEPVQAKELHQEKVLDLDQLEKEELQLEAVEVEDHKPQEVEMELPQELVKVQEKDKPLIIMEPQFLELVLDQDNQKLQETLHHRAVDKVKELLK